MCGRYGLFDISGAEILEDYYGDGFTPNFNVAPTQSMPVITESEGKRAVQIMHWGIRRKLGPDTEKELFNTRSEKAFDRFWVSATKSHRCLIPANGFYEWQTRDGAKYPFWIRDAHAPLLYFAGIYGIDAEGMPQYSIMTTAPNTEMRSVHDRMPVVLDDDARTIWLRDDLSDADPLRELLRPAPNHSLAMYEVSRDVNIARNNRGDLILPLNSK